MDLTSCARQSQTTTLTEQCERQRLEATSHYLEHVRDHFVVEDHTNVNVSTRHVQKLLYHMKKGTKTQ